MMHLKSEKIKLYSEPVYFLAILLLSFSVAMVTAADFGVSMIVAPAYILSLKVSFLTFGQSEYVLQSVLFLVFCILMRKIRLAYFSSFVNCLIYGAALDCWRLIIPWFNPERYAPGSFSILIRLLFFLGGMLLTAFSVALFYRTYLYPQVYDFFVKGISLKWGKDRTRFKMAFDASCLLISCLMTLLFFGAFRGIGIGTVVMTAFNGLLIGFFGRTFDAFFTLVPCFPKFAAYFDL